jgi:uncharacterized membrane protein
MARFDKARLREVLFRVSVLLKGLDAVLEIVAGAALWVAGPELVVRLARLLTRGELGESPSGLAANYLRESASRLTAGDGHFIVVYLLGHGIVKLFIVVALLKNKLWGYPLAMVVFGGFIVYQIYRFALAGEVALVALTIFDLIVILLIWLEYRAVKAHRR